MGSGASKKCQPQQIQNAQSEISRPSRSCSLASLSSEPYSSLPYFRPSIPTTFSLRYLQPTSGASTISSATQYTDHINDNSDVESVSEYDSDDHSLYRSETPFYAGTTTPQPAPPPIKHIIVGTSSQFSQCLSITLAKEFFNSLNWHSSLFIDSQDRCYCTNCYPTHWSDIITTGNANYVIPRGWMRLGLRVDPIHSDEHDIWNKWIVTFHGTTKTAARSILTHRQFYLPGDKLIDGTILGIRDGHILNQKFIYTSPTISYSSSYIYCPNNDFYSSTKNTICEAQMVLQCRQQPNSFKIQGETIGAGSNRICPYIPNSQIEYYTDIRSSIIAYGLLVRVREKKKPYY